MYHRKIAGRLKSALRRHHLSIKRSLHRRYPHALRTLRRHGLRLHHIRRHALRHAAAATVAGLLAITPLSAPYHVKKSHPAEPGANHELSVEAETNESLVGKLEHALSTARQGHISVEEEAILAASLSKRFNIAVRPEIDGHRLNKVTGVIGGEQHLKRYPGDVISSHANSDDERPYLAGMAPGLGAYGYFAQSKQAITEQDILKERYYIAAQTFLAPGWEHDPQKLYEFFRGRKVVVVNAHTGQGVVAVIGDAGPAEWTGKSFGGSPEVMHQVGYATGPRKGDVFVFFIDDPKNEVPLGKLEVTR